jgi:hypothetical protein
MPITLLKISGSGFDTKADLSVSFFDDNGFKLNIPVLVAESTSVTVSVPPYINPSTGKFTSGTVKVQVIQNSGGVITTSNTIQNLQLLDLPTTSAQPGAVTLNLLNGVIKYDLQLQGSIKGTLLDIPRLNAAIANDIANLQGLVAQIQTVYQNPSTTVTIGSIKGIGVVIGTQALQNSDRMIIGMFKSLISTTSPASSIRNSSHSEGIISGNASFLGRQEVTDPCAQAKNNYVNNMIAGTLSNDNNEYLGYGGCFAFSLPEVVKTANQVIVGAGTAALAFFGLAGATPIALALPSAALMNASIMSIVTQLDVAVSLKNSYDAGAYRAIHQAYDETISLITDLLVKQVISETAGYIKDVYTGSSDFIEGLLSTSTLVPTSTPLTGTWTGQWVWSGQGANGCTYNDGGSFSMTLTQTGNSFSGSIIAAGVETRNNDTCALMSSDSISGAASGTISGTTLNLSFELFGSVSTLTFSGTATLNGNTLTASFVRNTGGHGSFTLTKQ